MKVNFYIKRIKWLESLIDKAAKYVEKVESENKKLKAKVAELLKDRRNLLEGFWKADALEKENKELKAKIKDLERSKKADELLIKDLYNFLLEKEACNKCSESRINYKASKLDFVNPVYNDDQLLEEVEEVKEEVDDLKLELRKFLSNRLKNNKHKKIDKKA